MLDIKFIRQNPDLVRQAIKNKKIDLDLDKLLAMDAKRRELIKDIEKLRGFHKAQSSVIAGIKATKNDTE